MYLTTRSIFIAIVLILSAQSAMGQGRLSAGLRGGFNAVAIFPENSYGQRKLGYQIPIRPYIGLASQYEFGSRSAISLDIMFQRMGTRHEDRAKRRDFYKDIRLDYLVLPVMYKLILNPGGGRFDRSARRDEPKWFLSAGAQPGFLLSANNRYEVNGNRTDLISFITEGGNPNFDAIEQNGTPESDEELYQSFDLSFVGAAGVQLYAQSNLKIIFELRGGFSLVDINASQWRLPDENGNYYASRNMFIGANMSVCFGN